MQEKRECSFVLFLTEEEEYANTAHEGENGNAGKLRLLFSFLCLIFNWKISTWRYVCVFNVAVEQCAVTAVEGVVGLLARGAYLVGHGLIALRDTEFCKSLFFLTRSRATHRGSR